MRRIKKPSTASTRGSNCQKPNWNRLLVSLATNLAVISIIILITTSTKENTPSNNTALDPVTIPITVPLTATSAIKATDCISSFCSIERLAPNISIKTPTFLICTFFYYTPSELMSKITAITSIKKNAIKKDKTYIKRLFSCSKHKL